MTTKKTIAIVGHGIAPSILGGELSKEMVNVYQENIEIIEMGRDLMYDKPTKKQLRQVVIPVRKGNKYQNNAPCPCGSGIKYKKCFKHQ